MSSAVNGNIRCAPCGSRHRPAVATARRCPTVEETLCRPFAGESQPMEPFLERHSTELMTLVLAAMVLGTLLVIVPQLLRAHHRAMEMQHAEHLRALEAGQTPTPYDVRSRSAGRAAA